MMKFFKPLLFGIILYPFLLSAQITRQNPSALLSYQEMKFEQEKEGRNNFITDEYGRQPL
jgi:hypothetical protein